MSANNPETIKKLRKELRKFVAGQKASHTSWWVRAAMFSFSKENGKVGSVNYYCHGRIANGSGITGIVEHLQAYSEKQETYYPGFKKAFKAYVDYILNRHPLSSVALDKSAYRAIRYGLPVDVTKTNFEVRAFLMSLRRGKELPHACVVWKKLVDAGIDENVAFMVISTYEFGNTPYPNGVFTFPTYYFSGNSDHSLLAAAGSWKETFLFFKKPYVRSKRTRSFNEQTTISHIKKKVATFYIFNSPETMYGLICLLGGLRSPAVGSAWDSFLEVVKKIDAKFKGIN